MKRTHQVVACSLGCAALTFISSCGSKSESAKNPPTVTAGELFNDSQLTNGIVNASHGDALAAASDQGVSGARFEFLSDDQGSDDGKDDDSTSVTKTCTNSADGKSAVVALSSTVNRNRTKTSNGGRVTVTQSRTGTSTATRTWSRSDGSAVACNAAGTGANVNFQSPSGLKLDIAFERTRNDSQTFTGPKLTRSSTKSFSSSGKRTVTWSSNDTTDDSGTTYTRSKSVEIKDTVYKLSLTNKNGTAVNTELTMASASGSPLVVKVERNLTTHAVVSKTFVSGQLIVKKDSDATVTTTYDNLKINYADNSCSIVSGSAQVVVTDSNNSTLKTLTLGLNSDGDDSLRDSSETEIEGFSLDSCDSEDLKL